MGVAKVWCDDAEMNLRLIAGSVCAVLGSGCAAPSPTLDSLVGFSDPYRCEPNEEFTTLLNGLLRWEKTGETYVPVLGTPAVPAAFKPQADAPSLVVDGAEYRATLPLRGAWNGLPLRSIVLNGWIESEQGFYLVFEATHAQVMQAANRAGFAIPPSGREYREGDVLGVNVGVSEYEGAAALYCMPG